MLQPSLLYLRPIKRCFCLTYVCLSDVWLSVAYIGPNSRTERPRKIKIGTEVAHVTGDVGYLCATYRWLGHHFEGQKVIGQVVADVLNSQHAGTAATRRISTKILSTCRGRKHTEAASGTGCWLDGRKDIRLVRSWLSAGTHVMVRD